MNSYEERVVHPGTEQALFALSAPAGGPGASASPPRILSPTTGTILALDPDIPPRHQRLTLKAESPNVRWRLDGKALGRGQQIQWMPWPGRHVIEIADARGGSEGGQDNGRAVTALGKCT